MANELQNPTSGDEPENKSRKHVEASPPPADDVAILAAKKKELDTLKSQLDESTKTLNTLSADIKMLEARVAEIQSASDGFKAASAQLEHDLASSKKALATKISMAEAGIGDQKDVVDQKIESFKQALITQAAEVEALGKAAEHARQAYATAASTVAAKETAYNDLRNTQKNTDAAIRDARSLLDQASTAEAQGDVFGMYFLLKEASAKFAIIAVPKPADVEAKLKVAQADVEASKQTAVTRKQDSDKKTQAHVEAQKSLDADSADFRSNVLKQLKEMKPKSGVASTTRYLRDAENSQAQS
jgi:chromosome segregation ATPase